MKRLTYKTTIWYMNQIISLLFNVIFVFYVFSMSRNKNETNLWVYDIFVLLCVTFLIFCWISIESVFGKSRSEGENFWWSCFFFIKIIWLKIYKKERFCSKYLYTWDRKWLMWIFFIHLLKQLVFIRVLTSKRFDSIFHELSNAV